MVDEALIGKGWAIAPLAHTIISAYVEHNALPAVELPRLIADVYGALSDCRSGLGRDALPAKKPAIPIRQSVTADYLICLEDGRKLKTLRRHLRRKYNMSLDEYRAKWKLPSTYPMVAPNYTRLRSAIAKELGLGRNPRSATHRRR